MAIIPNNAQFRADTTGVPIVEKGSSQTKSRAAIFTMEDIKDSVGGTTGSGTINKVTKFTSETTIGDGLIDDNGTSVNNTGAGNITSNTAFGLDALISNTTGFNNTANGNQALYSNTTGANNTANGFQALFSNTTGSSNTASGLNALLSNTTGYNNTANGYYALSSNSNGANNTANGNQSLFSNTSGSRNTASGVEALRNNTTGTNNTASGYRALLSNTTGSANTALGYNTNSGNFNGSVILGYDAIATASNQFVVGSTTNIAGAVGTVATAQSRVWNVVINGVAEQILLA